VPISVSRKETNAEEEIVSPVERRSVIKRILISLLPSLILGFLFFFLIALSMGMEKMNQVSGAWFWIGFIAFLLMLVFLNGGEKIFGRFLQYMAFEFWASPIMMIWYTIASVGQASQSAKDAASSAGAAIGTGIGGTIMIVITVIIGGFGGLILFLIGHRLAKKKSE